MFKRSTATAPPADVDDQGDEHDQDEPKPFDVAAVEREILAGLPNEAKRRDAARVAHDYYSLDSLKYVPKREAEDDFDYSDRPKQIIPFARRVVQTLAKHLYHPGPTRQIADDDDASDWLNAVYTDNLINALFQRADTFAHLGGASAFQAAVSGDPRKPIKLHLWRSDELAVYPDSGTPQCVVTCGIEDETRTYTLWTATEYRVYKTVKFKQGETSGQVLPKRVAGKDGGGPNPYGCLPFSFVHCELPNAGFWEGEIGSYLVHANGTADEALSDLTHAIKKYLYPIGVAENCDVAFQPIAKFGAFVRLTSLISDLAHQSPARLSYLQAQLDIQGAWDHIEKSLFIALDALGIPRAAWRMDQPAAPSGIAILAEQLPLLERARERREPFRVYETDLARLCMAVAASSYPEYADMASIAEDFSLVLTWPAPSIPLPGPDQDAADQSAMDMGLTSRVMILQERYGLSRDQAIARIKQIAADKAEAEELDPTPDPLAGFADQSTTDPNQPPPAGPGDAALDPADLAA